MLKAQDMKDSVLWKDRYFCCSHTLLNTSANGALATMAFFLYALLASSSCSILASSYSLFNQSTPSPSVTLCRHSSASFESAIANRCMSLFAVNRVNICRSVCISFRGQQIFSIPMALFVSCLRRFQATFGASGRSPLGGWAVVFWVGRLHAASIVDVSAALA